MTAQNRRPAVDGLKDMVRTMGSGCCAEFIAIDFVEHAHDPFLRLRHRVEVNGPETMCASDGLRTSGFLTCTMTILGPSRPRVTPSIAGLLSDGHEPGPGHGPVS